MSTNTEAKFNHRDIAESEALPIDLYATIAESIDNIQTFTDLLNSNNPAATDEATHDQLLKQIDLIGLDVLSVLENYINSHDISPLVDEEMALGEETGVNNEEDNRTDAEIYESVKDHLATGRLIANEALVELKDTGDVEGAAVRFSEYFIQFAENNEYEPTLSILTTFLTKIFEMTPQSKKIHVADNFNDPASRHDDGVKTILSVGSAIADDLLIELSQVKKTDDIDRLASIYSESLAEYAQKMSDEGNPILLRGFLKKMLLAGIPQTPLKTAA
ncbi:MAG: hypothetical protein GQ532_16440 [Methylomarinum sp.]|nr:hypothetical protein [Methylomarinum sp.]